MRVIEEGIEVSNTLVFSEKNELLSEMLSGARRIIETVPLMTVSAVGWGDAAQCALYGAGHVYVLEGLSANQPVESVVPTIQALIQDTKPALVLIGATKHGKEIAARLAAILDAPCVTESNQISMDESGRITTVRNAYGGVALQTETFSSSGYPVIITVPPHSYTAEPFSVTPIVEQVPVNVSNKVQVVERLPKLAGTTDIAAANVVVCVGRGFDKQEDLALAQDMAAAIGGVVGCTRPISEDFHWLPTDTYIGLSGVKCKPKLFVSIGCSGQIQLVTGVRDSGVIFAVDSDESAPIWEAADYGIVGDLYEVVPALTAEFKKILA
jgi:electron transfer flavoprotein alpha subunit